MAYVRTRTTETGVISTALVESYRDEHGRPRQRLLANLRGEPDTLSALAKLAVRREALRKEKEALAKERIDADQFYEIVTLKSLHGHHYSSDERDEIDRLMRARTRLLKRLDRIEKHLVAIEREGTIIKKHCAATPEEIQAAIKAYREKQRDAEALMLAMEFGLKEAKAEYWRISR